MEKVITISREFGSGGRELGVKLAGTLGIPFYDKELISMAADDINIAEEAFRYYDEHIEVRDPLDRQFYHAFSEIYQVPMSDQIFVAQSNVIRRLASHGPCVIVGRCADMVLADSVNLFIYSKMKDRVKRMCAWRAAATRRRWSGASGRWTASAGTIISTTQGIPGGGPRIIISAWRAGSWAWTAVCARLSLIWESLAAGRRSVRAFLGHLPAGLVRYGLFGNAECGVYFKSIGSY